MYYADTDFSVHLFFFIAVDWFDRLVELLLCCIYYLINFIQNCVAPLCSCPSLVLPSCGGGLSAASDSHARLSILKSLAARSLLLYLFLSSMTLIKVWISEHGEMQCLVFKYQVWLRVFCCGESLGFLPTSSVSKHSAPIPAPPPSGSTPAAAAWPWAPTSLRQGLLCIHRGSLKREASDLPALALSSASSE